MSEKCEVCGRDLNAFNRAWGTQKCSACAKGRSPQAKKAKNSEILDRTPFQNKEEILNSKITSTLVKACVLLLIVNLVAHIGHLLAATTKNDSFYWIEILAFVGGIWLGSVGIFGEANLLDIRRWKRCWHGDLLGYFLGYIIIIILPAFYRARMMATGQSPSPKEGSFLFLVALILPVLCGIVLGVFNAIRADKKEKDYTSRVYEEWVSARKQPTGNP